MLEEKERSELARRCWEEIKDRALRGEELSDWERKTIEFFEKRRVSMEEWERLRKSGE